MVPENISVLGSPHLSCSGKLVKWCGLRSPFRAKSLSQIPATFFSQVSNDRIYGHSVNINTTMPPATKTKIPHRSNGHKRFEASNVQGLNLSDKESESGAVVQRPAAKEREPEWEGFEEEDDDHSVDEEHVDIISEAEEEGPEKDEEEEELERLVFGDSAGFKEGIKSFSLDPLPTALGESSDEERNEDGNLDNIADQDLFFFDSGPTVAPTALVHTDTEEEDGDKPAWDDSDDDKLVVSLASVPQLRKLREAEEDNMVDGKEYVRRLRKQYLRLHPTPDWALHATGKVKRKRTRAVEDAESEEDSVSDMDVDDEDLSTQPLARLLKDADILSRNLGRNPSKRRKLQAGTVDIQRLKDVCKAGPACVFSPFKSRRC